jgi:hypothetical protein
MIRFKGFSTDGRRAGEIFEITDVVKIGELEIDVARHGLSTIIEPFDIAPFISND